MQRALDVHIPGKQTFLDVFLQQRPERKASHMQEEDTWVVCSKVIQSEARMRQDAAFEAQVLERWLDDGGTQDTTVDREDLPMQRFSISSPNESSKRERPLTSRHQLSQNTSAMRREPSPVSSTEKEIS